MKEDQTTKQAEILFYFGMKMRDHMITGVSKAHSLLAERAITVDLSPPQIHMLMTIRKQGETTISELAGRLSVSAPSASTMVDRLVEKGALVRERSQKDRRVVVVRLSKVADDFIEKVEKIMLEEFTKFIHKLGPELTTQWCDVVNSIQQVMMKDEEND